VVLVVLMVRLLGCLVVVLLVFGRLLVLMFLALVLVVVRSLGGLMV
jgi:hypothetical protein